MKGINERKERIILKTSMCYNLGEEMENHVIYGKKGGVKGDMGVGGGRGVEIRWWYVMDKVVCGGVP